MKERLKNKRGITLIALIITVVVMLILAGVAISVLVNGDGLFNKTRAAAEEYKSAAEEEAAIVSDWIAEIDQYLSGVPSNPGDDTPTEPEDTTAPETATIEVSNIGVTTFTLTATGADSGSGVAKYEFYVKNAEGEFELEETRNVTAGTVVYEVTGKSGGQEYEYKVIVYDAKGNSSEDTVTVTTTAEALASTGEWLPSKGVNSPKLVGNMQAIYFNSSGTEVPLTETSTETEWNNWYDYSSKNWANAKTSDGSYWVWIPRYAYKITDRYQTSFADANQSTPYIDIVFVDTNNKNGETTYEAPTDYEAINTNTGYYVHPAFIKDDDATVGGVAAPYNNGGWRSDLPGIWVAKFEMSAENGSGAANTSPGDNLTSSTLKMVSKPNRTSWKSIKIGNIFTNAKNYDTSINLETLDSHLMKNSEWGAVAYLGHSKYGLNGTNIAVNDANTYTTGEGSAWNTTNKTQSTTGNASGVYDMSGCSYEYVAAYVANNNDNIEIYSKDNNNSMFASKADNPASTEYVTVYKEGASDSQELHYKANSKKGDAVRETSSSTNGWNGSNSWYGDYSNFPYSTLPFFERGGGKGNGTAAGLFVFDYNTGNAGGHISFRVCLAP